MPSGALRRLFLLAEFVAALTRRGLGKRFTLDRGDDNTAMYKKHVGQAAAKRGDQCPEQEFADLHWGSLLPFLPVLDNRLCRQELTGEHLQNGIPQAESIRVILLTPLGIV